MRHILSILASIICTHGVVAQSADLEYFTLCRKGNGFYEVKKYKESGEAYSKAFRVKGATVKGRDRYDAACSWALAGFPDSALIQLDLAAREGKFSDYYHLIQDPDLRSLYRYKEWKTIVEKVQKNKEEKQTGLNKPLTSLLEAIFYTDQKYRLQMEEAEQKYGHNSKEIKALWDSTNKQDEANLKLITGILDQYGWLGRDVVGDQGNAALFLVIQHSDQATQEKYLPMMRDAVKAGNAEPSSLALLEDRVALGQGKKQIYGSQIGMDANGKYVVSPIEDEGNVNKRRAEVGLEPLEEYVKHWGIVYKPGTFNSPPVGFWETYRIYLLLGCSFMLFALGGYVATRAFKVSLVSSAWFWFYLISFCTAMYGWYRDVSSFRNSFYQDPVKAWMYVTILYLIMPSTTILINVFVSKLSGWKRLVLDLLNVCIGLTCLLLLAPQVYKLFYPNGRISFFFSVIPLLIAAGIFLVIWLILFAIKKISARRLKQAG